ncbi:hypothetical protein BMS3Bbin09_01698 [bacterium BMS3Bbin09]|nr:hypothetical protein BMS3Bbin09_01698 [bacterium BMS3Bbin09]
MTVETTVSFARVPCFFISSAQRAIILSPSISSPFSSQSIVLSASPSCAIPMSALCSRTALCIPSGCVAPQFSLMFSPSGLAFIEITSAPSSSSTNGVILYAEPLLQSITTFMPSRVLPLGKVDLTYSIYLPAASSTLCALPIPEPSGLIFSSLLENISFSIARSVLSGSLNPSEEKNFIPLSS